MPSRNYSDGDDNGGDDDGDGDNNDENIMTGSERGNSFLALHN